jgi:uncharacterized RDD family membrane protein YckC
MRTPEQAVVYRIEDHLTVVRRLIVDIIDTTVATIVSLLITIGALPFADHEVVYFGILVTWPLVWVAYFVVLKASRFRTVGYVLCGARIVNLRGERPGYFALLGRLAFVLLGPFNFLVDLLWISSDPCRQALRDKVAHTYVIKISAVPSGAGQVVYRIYTVFGMTLLFAEVQAKNAAA